MTILEKLAKQIYEECKRDGEPITMKEAREMAEMEVKAKVISASERTESEKPKKERKPRVRKVDKTKEQLLSNIKDLLESIGATNTSIMNEVELSFDFQDSNYSVRLIKHRAKKGE